MQQLESPSVVQDGLPIALLNNAAQRAVVDALNRTQFGVIITPHGQPPAFLNEYARRVLSRHDGLTIGEGGLQALRSSDTRLLRDAVQRACERQLTSCVTLVLPRAASGRPFAVHVPALPFSGAGANLATVFVCDPDAEHVMSEASLTRLYGLTRAEAAFAVLLTSGKSVEQTAQHLFISIHTARTHLKRILLKTETSRQGELMRLLLTCSAQLRLD